LKGKAQRTRRRWSFGSATFDETSWTLSVDGQRVPVEAKPLALLHELLVNAGEMVPKEVLMESVWPDVFVAEASLTTAMRKLRQAIGDKNRDQRMIETISGIGYRLNIPVSVEIIADQTNLAELSDAGHQNGNTVGAVNSAVRPTLSAKLVLATLGTVLFIAVSVITGNGLLASRRGVQSDAVDRAEVLSALRRLDVAKIEQLNKAGWDPNRSMSADKNAALHLALEICEWNPNHDKEKLLLLVRMLYDGGAKIDLRNIWGDTPYSIAKADRFCGPDHPVTRMMKTECSSGPYPLGDKCLATYEIARRDQTGQTLR
jgi:DNA-binding winged helix-turn-helix (wHTH) protein